MGLYSLGDYNTTFFSFQTNWRKPLRWRKSKKKLRLPTAKAGNHFSKKASRNWKLKQLRSIYHLAQLQKILDTISLSILRHVEMFALRYLTIQPYLLDKPFAGRSSWGWGRKGGRGRRLHLFFDNQLGVDLRVFATYAHSPVGSACLII